jgi:serine/threonine protein kinase
MIGKSVSHYKILEKLGEGGMGKVYLAEDLHLERMVAIKFLPQPLMQDKDNVERFRREAKVAASLNHPNIVTIYEIAEETDHATASKQSFIVMEYVEGKTLDEKMKDEFSQEGRSTDRQGLNIIEVIDYITQIACGLQKAHGKGIIHRDIKPANIMITNDGSAKILDFGLAKLKGGSKLTKEFAIMGTISYMSPEQISGEEVDQRTDMWSLGVLMYEMLGDELPFKGEYDQALFYTILNTDPKPLADLPDPLCRIIDKTLAKLPVDRYQSMEEFLSDLKHWDLEDQHQIAVQQEPSVDKPGTIKSLAVLPLKNLPPDPEQEYFADGMTEALITELAKLGSLKIISRTSVMRYKNTDLSLPEIAKELHIDAVVEGSVIRADQQVRINTQLIHAASDTHLWADSYDRDLENILFLQQDIARAIALEIDVKLTPQQQKKLTAARPVNPESYEAYLKGLFHWYKLTSIHFDTALKYYKIACDKDPNYALPYVGVAATWFARSYWSLEPPEKVVSEVKPNVLKAIELDSSLENAHLILAHIKFYYEWDWSGAERTYQHAIDLNPNYADSRLFYSAFLRSMGRPEDAFNEANRGLDLDPHNFFAQSYYVGHLLYLRQFDEAIKQLTKTLKEEPDFPMAHRYLWVAYQQKELYDQALKEAQQYFNALNKSDIADALVSGSKQSGYTGAMNRAAQVLVEQAKGQYVQPVYIARFYAYAGNKEQALVWLEQGYQSRDLLMVNLSTSCDWDNLRENPGFQDLLKRMNFPL